jgi:hypothetical protein
MSAGSPEPTGQVVPLEGNANGRQSNTAAGPLGLSLMTIDAGRQMAEMERLFGAAGNHTGQMEALTTLLYDAGSSIRGWTVHLGRERARLLGGFNRMAGMKSDRCQRPPLLSDAGND